MVDFNVGVFSAFFLFCFILSCLCKIFVYRLTCWADGIVGGDSRNVFCLSVRFAGCKWILLYVCLLGFSLELFLMDVLLLLLEFLLFLFIIKSVVLVGSVVVVTALPDLCQTLTKHGLSKAIMLQKGTRLLVENYMLLKDFIILKFQVLPTKSVRFNWGLNFETQMIAPHLRNFCQVRTLLTMQCWSVVAHRC